MVILDFENMKIVLSIYLHLFVKGDKGKNKGFGRPFSVFSLMKDKAQRGRGEYCLLEPWCALSWVPTLKGIAAWYIDR